MGDTHSGAAVQAVKSSFQFRVRLFIVLIIYSRINAGVTITITISDYFIFKKLSGLNYVPGFVRIRSKNNLDPDPTIGLYRKYIYQKF